ncbi:MAG: hypothetical protein ABRQ38_27530 [Candidatus Eremiobacterota bacterium]
MIIGDSMVNSVSLQKTGQVVKKEEPSEQKDGFAQSAPEEKTGYGANLLQSIKYGAAKGIEKGMEWGADIASHIVPQNYDLLSALGMLMVGPIFMLPIACITGPVGAVVGTALGLVGSSVDKPDMLKSKEELQQEQAGKTQS